MISYSEEVVYLQSPYNEDEKIVISLDPLLYPPERRSIVSALKDSIQEGLEDPKKFLNSFTRVKKQLWVLKEFLKRKLNETPSKDPDYKMFENTYNEMIKSQEIVMSILCFAEQGDQQIYRKIFPGINTDLN